MRHAPTYSDWGAIITAAYSSANGRWYAPDGTPSGVNNGTTNTPRFNSAQTSSLVTEGGMTLVAQPVSGQQYAFPFAHFQIDQSPPSAVKFSVFFGYATNNEADSVTYGECSLNFGRYISADDEVTTFAIGHLEQPNSYRVSAGSHTDGVTLTIALTDRGTRLAQVDSYMDEAGGKTIIFTMIGAVLTKSRLSKLVLHLEAIFLVSLKV